MNCVAASIDYDEADNMRRVMRVLVQIVYQLT
jgi:hypothetical protein